MMNKTVLEDLHSFCNNRNRCTFIQSHSKYLHQTLFGYTDIGFLRVTEETSSYKIDLLENKKHASSTCLTLGTIKQIDIQHFDIQNNEDFINRLVESIPLQRKWKQLEACLTLKARYFFPHDKRLFIAKDGFPFREHGAIEHSKCIGVFETIWKKINPPLFRILEHTTVEIHIPKKVDIHLNPWSNHTQIACEIEAQIIDQMDA